MLSILLKNGVCLAEDEEFSRSTDKKLRILNNKKGVMDKKHQEMVDFNLKYKIKDNNLLGIKLRKRRNWLRGRLEENLGSRSPECRKIFGEVKEFTRKYREKIKVRNMKKTTHLTQKYGRKTKFKHSEETQSLGYPTLSCSTSIDQTKLKLN